MNAKILSLILIVLLLSPGCVWSRRKIRDNDVSLVGEQVRLEEAANHIKENSDTITELSEDITEKADDVIRKYPKVEEGLIIKSHSEKITLLSGQNSATADQLKELNEQLGERNEEIQALKDEIQKWEDESYRKQKQIWIAIMSLAAIGMVTGIFLIISNYAGKLGFTLLAGSGATAAVSYFMVNYAGLVAVAGGILLVAVLGYVLYNAWVDRKACEENIMALEVSKHYKWDRNMKDKIQRLQSDSTRKRVKQFKDDLKQKGYYLMPNEDNLPTSVASSSAMPPGM